MAHKADFNGATQTVGEVTMQKGNGVLFQTMQDAIWRGNMSEDTREQEHLLSRCQQRNIRALRQL